MTGPEIKVFPLGEFQTNCHVVTPATAAPEMPCWLVDCGSNPGVMLDWIAHHKLKPSAILLTHAHHDHIDGVDAALSRFGAMPLAIHEAEAGFCSDPLLNLSAMLGLQSTCTEPNRLLRDGENLTLGDTSWRVLHTPGHSPGGICFVHDESRQAITGDVLFAGSIGRFDFPTSNADHLRHSILDVLMVLPDDVTIYPGHGPRTTIGRERATNPYVLGGF